MTDTDIYRVLERYTVHSSHFFGRALNVVPVSVFEMYVKDFFACKSIFTRKKNFRTRSTFKHIHAVQTGVFVEFHWDYGNVYQSPLMALPHLIIDVLPYFVWHLLTLRKPYTPQLDDGR